MKMKGLLTKHQITLIVFCFFFIISPLYCTGSWAATTDKASFVSETISDNTKVTGGSSFNKTWKIKNSGSSTWNSSYKLKYASNSGGRLSSTSEVKISGSVSPGNTYTFTVPMKAPAAQTSEKTYREDWKFTSPSGSTISVGGSPTVWAQIKVSAAAPPPTTDKASLASETIPDNTKVTGGTSFDKKWTIKNSGTSTWTSSYKLKYASDSGGRLSSTNEVPISGSVSPGNSYTFTVPMKAPAAQTSEKTYREDWKFTSPSGSTISVGGSPTVWAQIKVSAAAPPPTTDKASLVSETIPDNTKVTGGTSFDKKWTIKNSGTSTWTSSYKLKYASDSGGRLSSTNEVPISGSVSPGNSYTFTVPMKAPAAQTSEKTYKEDWKFAIPSGATISVGGSPIVWAQIKVPGLSNDPGSFPAVDWNSSAYRSANYFWNNLYAPQIFYSDGRISKLGSAKGNCTWYAHGRLRQLGYTFNLNVMTGDAYTWSVSANTAGITVNTTPTAGAIAQSTANRSGYNSHGHVAVVEKVNSDGTLLISESSYAPGSTGWDFQFRTRPVNKSEFNNYIHVTKQITTPVTNSLSVPYLKQQDIPTIGSAACASASSAMVLAYHRKIVNSQQDMINAAKIVFNATSSLNYGLSSRDTLATHLHQVWGFSSVRFDPSYWDTLYQTIKSEISKGRPMILGSRSMTSAGHYIVVIGYEGDDYITGKLIVNDPFGRWNGSRDSYSTSVSGAGLRYSFTSITSSNSDGVFVIIP